MRGLRLLSRDFLQYDVTNIRDGAVAMVRRVPPSVPTALTPRFTLKFDGKDVDDADVAYDDIVDFGAQIC